MLDNQIQFNKGLRMYGNMTKEEKQLNKDDLLAYQNFDNKQYALGFMKGLFKSKKEDPLKNLKLSDQFIVNIKQRAINSKEMAIVQRGEGSWL